MRNLLRAVIFSLLSVTATAQTAPSVSIVAGSALVCTSKPVMYSAATSETELSYLWAVVPSKGLSAFTDLNSPTVTLTFTGTSTYTVFLNATNKAGLTTIKAHTVAPARSAKASFNASLNTVGYPTQLVLTNYSTNSLRNYWSFNDNTTDSTSYNLVKEYGKSGRYSVKLFVEGTKGCNDSAHYDFFISDSSGITLPNVFSPNGDGSNDVYRPITRGISTLNAWVFSRTGVIVCTWDKSRGGWDGHSTSGEECPEGVYFIVLEAMGFDGKSHKLKGTITLVR